MQEILPCIAANINGVYTNHISFIRITTKDQYESSNVTCLWRFNISGFEDRSRRNDKTCRNASVIKPNQPRDSGEIPARKLTKTDLDVAASSSDVEKGVTIVSSGLSQDTRIRRYSSTHGDDVAALHGGEYLVLWSSSAAHALPHRCFSWESRHRLPPVRRSAVRVKRHGGPCLGLVIPVEKKKREVSHLWWSLFALRYYFLKNKKNFGIKNKNKKFLLFFSPTGSNF